MVPPCRGNVQWSKGHPYSMDGAGFSWTYTGQIATEVSESVRQWHANRCGSQTEVKRVVCELWWTDWTTCGVSASPETIICQMYVK